MNIYETLECLKDWKRLPAYKAEPRIDFIVAGALPEIIRLKYNASIKLIIPELPIRIGTLFKNKSNNLSYKIDFYINLENGKHIFVEFKTDSNSRNDEQDKTLTEACKIGMTEILNGIININYKTKYKYRSKYLYLMNKLCNADLVSKIGPYYKTNQIEDNIELLYIQPKASRENEIGFIEIAQLMKGSEDTFYKKISEILISWAND